MGLCYNNKQPWPVSLSWLGIVLQCKRLLVQFLVTAHAWVAGLIPSEGTYKRQQIDVSLSHRCFSPSFSLPFPLSKNKLKKYFLKIVNKTERKLVHEWTSETMWNWHQWAKGKNSFSDEELKKKELSFSTFSILLNDKETLMTLNSANQLS